MPGRKAASAEDWLERFRSGYPALSSEHRSENFIRAKTGAFGDLILVCFLRDLAKIDNKDLQNSKVNDFAIPKDFLSKGKGKLGANQKQKLIAYFRSKLRSDSWHVPNDYFERPFSRLYELQLALDPAHKGTDFSRDLQGLPSAHTHIETNERRKVIENLANFAVDHDRRLYILTGDEGRGKSVLIAKFLTDSYPITSYRPIYINIRELFSFYRFVSHLHGILCVTENSEIVPPTSELIANIRKTLEVTPVFLIIDNSEIFAQSEHDGYHAIRADNLFDFIIDLASANTNIKILLTSAFLPEGLDDVVNFVAQADSEIAPQITPADWLTMFSANFPTNDYQERNCLESLIANLAKRDVPGPLYLLACAALRYDPSAQTVGELLPKILRRNYLGTCNVLVQKMSDFQAGLLHLIAASEDGLKISTLKTLALALNVIPSDKVDHEISTFQDIAAPLVMRLPQEDELALDIHWRVRKELLRKWDGSQRRRDGQFHTNIERKRATHREIARIAIEAAEHASSKNAAVMNQRFIQAYKHLLASLNPASFSHLGKRQFSLAPIAQYLAKIKNRTEQDADCIHAAIFIWNDKIGIEETLWGISKSRRALSAYEKDYFHGADALKIDLLLNIFHIGYSYHLSDQPTDVLRSRIPTDIDRIGIENGTLFGLRDLFIDVYRRIAISAFRAHKIDIANIAIDRGKVLIESRFDQAATDPDKRQTGERGASELFTPSVNPQPLFRRVPAKHKYDRHMTTLMSVHLDLLIRQGKLSDAESLALEYVNHHYHEYVQPRIFAHKEIRVGRKRKRQVGSRRTFDDLKMTLFANIKLRSKLTEALYLQGRIHATARQLQRCFQGFSEVITTNEMEFERFGEGHVLVHEPIENSHLRSVNQRNLIRVAARATQLERNIPNSLFSEGLPQDASREARSIENRARLRWAGRAALRLVNVDHTERDYDHDRVSQQMDYMMWLRFRVDRERGERRLNTIEDLANASDVALDQINAGQISPSTKMNVLLERSRTLWLLAQLFPERTELLDRAITALLRVRWGAKSRNYPLVICDSNLLLVEILDLFSHSTATNAIKLSRENLISEASWIIETCNYGLRWPEYDILSSNRCGEPPPSRLFVC